MRKLFSLISVFAILVAVVCFSVMPVFALTIDSMPELLQDLPSSDYSNYYIVVNSLSFDGGVTGYTIYNLKSPNVVYFKNSSDQGCFIFNTDFEWWQSNTQFTAWNYYGIATNYSTQGVPSNFYYSTILYSAVDIKDKDGNLIYSADSVFVPDSTDPTDPSDPETDPYYTNGVVSFDPDQIDGLPAFPDRAYDYSIFHLHRLVKSDGSLDDYILWEYGTPYFKAVLDSSSSDLSVLTIAFNNDLNKSESLYRRYYRLVDGAWQLESVTEDSYNMIGLNYLPGSQIIYSEFKITDFTTGELIHKPDSAISGGGSIVDPSDSTDPTDPEVPPVDGEEGDDGSFGWLTGSISSLGDLWEVLEKNTLAPVLDFFTNILKSDAIDYFMQIWEFPIINDLLIAVVSILVVGGIIMFFGTL